MTTSLATEGRDLIAIEKTDRRAETILDGIKPKRGMWIVSHGRRKVYGQVIRLHRNGDVAWQGSLTAVRTDGVKLYNEGCSYVNEKPTGYVQPGTPEADAEKVMFEQMTTQPHNYAAELQSAFNNSGFGRKAEELIMKTTDKVSLYLTSVTSASPRELVRETKVKPSELTAAIAEMQKTNAVVDVSSDGDKTPLWALACKTPVKKVRKSAPKKAAKKVAKKAAKKTPAKKAAKKTPAKKKAAPAKKSDRKPRARADGKASVSARSVDLIRQGKTNAQVFVILQKEYDLPETKKHYPSWYRSKLVRDGVMTKAQAYPAIK